MDASRRDWAMPLAAIIVVAGLAWTWLLSGAGMHEMSMGDMTMRPDWTVGYAALCLAMWIAMMVAMMLPSATPALLGGVEALPFAAAYLAVWSGFSVAATLLQYALDSRDLFSGAMAVRSDAQAAVVILAVGVYQLSPWKQACLRNCVSVSGSEARDASFAGSAKLGLRYGAYCLGCCWALMALLFVAGLMNLFWVAAIALWLTAEKLFPFGGYLARVAGAALAAWGATLLALAVA